MDRWSKSNTPDGDIIARQATILRAVGEYVECNQPKLLPPDPKETQLKEAAILQPHNDRCQKDYANYCTCKSEQRGRKELRKLRRAPVRSRSSFHNGVRLWLLTPFRTNNLQPTKDSADRHLPALAGDPPWARSRD